MRRAGRAAGRRGGLHPSGCCCRAGIAACRVAPVTVIEPGWSLQNQLSAAAAAAAAAAATVTATVTATATATATQPQPQSQRSAAAATATARGERRAYGDGVRFQQRAPVPGSRQHVAASHRARSACAALTVDHACHLSDRSPVTDPLRTTAPIFCCTRTTMRWRKYRQFAGARRSLPRDMPQRRSSYSERDSIAPPCWNRHRLAARVASRHCPHRRTTRSEVQGRQGAMWRDIHRSRERVSCAFFVRAIAVCCWCCCWVASTPAPARRASPRAPMSAGSTSRLRPTRRRCFAMRPATPPTSSSCSRMWAATPSACACGSTRPAAGTMAVTPWTRPSAPPRRACAS